MKNLLCIAAFVLALADNVFAQTLVNTSWIDTLGQPAYFYSNIIPYVDGSQVMLISNAYVSGILSQSEAELLNSDGSMAWQENFTIPGYASNYGTATYIKNSYCYATGVGLDSAGLHSNFYIYKLKQSDGSIVWDTIYAGAYAGYEVPIGIVVDDTGNVYIGGTEQVDSFEFRMTVIKYDSNGHQLWVGSYDSTGLYTGAVGMLLSGGTLAVTGFSGTNYSSWDFATVAFNSSTGAVMSVSRSGNGSGAFSTPAGIMKESNRFIITGTAATSTGHTVIKTISYDSLFNQQWVTTWGDSTSANSAAASLTEDNNGNPAITGYTTAGNGAKQTAVLSYNGGTSSLNFATTLSAPNSANDAQGISICADANSIYSAASVSNGSTHSMVTTAIDYSGNIRWQKTFNRASGTDDIPLAAVPNGGDVIVTGKSSGTDTLYMAVDYSQFAKTNTLDSVSGTGGADLYEADQIIVRFDPSAVNTDAVNNLDINFAPPSYWLTPSADSALQANVPFDLSTCTMERIYKGLKTTYKYSTARNGDQVLMPNLWAGLLLIYPDQGKSEEVSVAQGINAMFPMVTNTNLNYVGQLNSGECYNTDPHPVSCRVNDTYFGGTIPQQQNLWDDSLTNGSSPYGYCQGLYNINIDSAWRIETGKPFVKVGIYDSGLDGQHQDFCPSPLPNGNPGSKVNGWDFYNNVSLPSENFANADLHGTAVGGIVGAIRNNGEGIAGIAGGSYTDTTDVGITLYGMTIVSEPIDMITLPMADLCNALVQGSSFVSDSAYGFGLHVINNSWGMQGIDYASSIASFSELELACKTVYKNQTTIVASAGNTATTFEFPANFYNDWILCAGGANDSGGWFNSGTMTYTASAVSPCVDVIAPSTSDGINGTYVATTLALNQGHSHQFGGYDMGFFGTSMASPHVTGTVALLMSYLDSSASVYSNLSPEDAEHLITRSADNMGYIGHSDSTGWGALNSGRALQGVNKGCKELVHFGFADSLDPPVAHYVAFYVPIKLTEFYTNPSGQGFDTLFNNTTPYLCTVIQVTSTMPHSLDSNFAITDYWTRPSSTTLMLAYDSVSHTLQPFEHLYIDSMTTTSATVSGYYYFVYSPVDSSALGVWGADSAMLSYSADFRFDYTLLLTNSSATCNPVDTTTTHIKDLTNQMQVLFYPNPVQDAGLLQIFSDGNTKATIDVEDQQGRKIETVYSGDLSSGNSTLNIDTKPLSSGLYFIVINSGEGSKTIKFVKYG